MAHADLAAALARVADRLVRPGLAAAALAAVAAHEPRDLDLRVEAGRGVLERDLELVLQILAAHRARAAAAATAGAGEEVLEDVLEERAEAALEPAAGGDPRCRAEAVVVRPLVGIREDPVGLVDFLEALLGLRIAGVLVRMELHRELAVHLLQLGLARVLRDAEHLVVVA